MENITAKLKIIEAINFIGSFLLLDQLFLILSILLDMNSMTTIEEGTPKNEGTNDYTS
jgi:hypothetical protein